MQVTKFHFAPSCYMHGINKHEDAQLYRVERIQKVRNNFRKSKNWVFEVLDGRANMFRRVNAVEGLAYDQIFCTSDCWVDRPGTVLTSFVKNCSWCGYRYRISFWMAIVLAHPLSKALSHTCSQHLMFRMCFRDWCLLALVRVRFLSQGNLAHAQTVCTRLSFLLPHTRAWERGYHIS